MPGTLFQGQQHISDATDDVWNFMEGAGHDTSQTVSSLFGDDGQTTSDPSGLDSTTVSPTNSSVNTVGNSAMSDVPMPNGSPSSRKFSSGGGSSIDASYSLMRPYNPQHRESQNQISIRPEGPPSTSNSRASPVSDAMSIHNYWMNMLKQFASSK